MGRNGQPTRAKILSESKELIFENGFAGTSIDQILERSGITKGAFFYHFKTKSELALVLMSNFIRDDLEVLDTVLNQTAEKSDHPKDRLLDFIQYFIDAFSKVEQPSKIIDKLQFPFWSQDSEAGLGKEELPPQQS